MPNSPRWFACLSAWMVFTACGSRGLVINHPDDAKHAKIGVMTGTTGEAIAKNRFPQADIKSFDDIMDGVAAMKSGAWDYLRKPFEVDELLAVVERAIETLRLAAENASGASVRPGSWKRTSSHTGCSMPRATGASRCSSRASRGRRGQPRTMQFRAKCTRGSPSRRPCFGRAVPC